MNIKLDNNYLEINFNKNFWRIFFYTLIFSSILVFIFGSRADVYMVGLEEGYTGFRPIGYPIILKLLSLFMNYETVKYAAIFINGIFFSFILSILIIISKNFNSQNSLSYLILIIFLSPLFYEVFVIRETLLYTFLTLLIVVNFSKWHKNSTLYGVVLGLLYIVRPTGIVAILAFILAVLIFFNYQRNKIYFLKKFLNTISWFLIIAGTSIFIIYFKFNVLVFSPSCTSELNLFIGLSATNSMAYIFTDMGEYLDPNRITICQDIKIYKSMLRGLFESIPSLELFKSFIIKFFLYFFSYLPLGSAEILILENNQIQIKNFQYNIFRVLASIASFIPSIFVLIVLVIRFSKKLLSKIDFFLLFYVLGHGAIYAFTWPEARYRLPIDPILLMYLFFPLNKNTDDIKNIIILIYHYFKLFLIKIKKT